MMILWDVVAGYGDTVESVVYGEHYPYTAIEALKYGEHTLHILGLGSPIGAFTSKEEAQEWLKDKPDALAVFPFDWDVEAWG